MFSWLAGSASSPPAFLKLRSSKTFIIITVSTAVFSDVFTYGIVVPVMPFALTERSGVDPAKVQTWVSIFLAVYGGALLFASPFYGWLADRSTSRRVPLLLGLLALGASTVMLCVGNSIAILAAGRVLQGVSAAVVWIVGLALMVDTVGPEGLGQAMGYVGLSMSLAILLAPLLGGVVFAASGYYAVFFMAFGLIALDIILRILMIEKKVAVKWLPKEEVGQKAVTGDPQATDISKADTKDTTADMEKGIPMTESKLSMERGTKDELNTSAAEITNEQTTQAPKKWSDRLPAVIYLLSSRRILNALWSCLINSTLFTAFDAILPIFVKDTFHWDSTGAGLIFLPLVVVSFAGPLIGTLSDKYGPRWLATSGFVLACPFLILLRLVHENTIGHKVLLSALLALIGTALTLIMTPMMAEIAKSVSDKAARHPPGFFGKNGAYAQAYSLFNVAWAAGCLVGPLLAGLIKQKADWAVTVLVLGILSLVSAIPTVIWSGGSIFKERRHQHEEADRIQTSVDETRNSGP